MFHQFCATISCVVPCLEERLIFRVFSIVLGTCWGPLVSWLRTKDKNQFYATITRHKTLPGNRVSFLAFFCHLGGLMGDLCVMAMGLGPPRTWIRAKDMEEE